MMIALYAASLLPSTGRLADNNHESDLRLVIQALQNLQPKTAGSTTDFEKNFIDSIQTIEAAAGLHSFIIKATTSDESKPPTLIAVNFRLPHILSGEINLPPPAVRSSAYNLLISSSYISPELSLETPPPLFS